MEASDDTSGGFLRPALVSTPPPSTSGTSSAGRALPVTRKQPLALGGAKEAAFINHVDRGITQINRKFAKRDTLNRMQHSAGEAETSVKGYSSFSEAARDIDALLDLVWISGTPSLQIPYILSLASTVTDFVSEFPPAPKAMFALLSKLDLAFSSLLHGHDAESGEALPGFEAGRNVSRTERVRIKSLVERTRVVVVEAMNKGEFEYEEADDPHTEQENDSDQEEDFEEFEDRNDLDMDVARVYDRTVVELGDALDGPSIGIPDA